MTNRPRLTVCAGCHRPIGDGPAYFDRPYRGQGFFCEDCRRTRWPERQGDEPEAGPAEKPGDKSS